MAGLGFAREQLEKQGWKEGKGLGKEEDGIKEAIKVGIKNDTQGVGYKISEQFTFHWWDHIFNKTAKSIVISEKEDGIEVSKSDSKYLPISTQRPNKHSEKPLLYGRFVKASASSKLDTDSDESDSDVEKDFSTEHAEDIVFKKCGGRTAHKGARHGLKLNGKLKRIEEHDKVAMSEPCSRSTSPDIRKQQDMDAENSRKLLKSERKKALTSYSDSEEYVKRKKKKTEKVYNGGVSVDEGSSSFSEKKKRKKRKSKMVHYTYKDECCASVDEESCSLAGKKKMKKCKTEESYDICMNKCAIDEESCSSAQRKRKKRKSEAVHDSCEDKSKDLTQKFEERKAGSNVNEHVQSKLKKTKKKGLCSDRNVHKDTAGDLEQREHETAEVIQTGLEKIKKKKKKKEKKNKQAD